MIPNLQPYPAYKDSGVPWLGKVPAHWEVRSLGALTSSRTERGRPDLPLLSVVREKGVIPRASMAEDENRNFIPDDLTNYKVVREGDLVINKMKAWQGSMGIAPCDGVVSPAYYVFEFNEDLGKFGHRLLRSRTYVGFFAQASDGVRIGQWDLSIAGMKRIPGLLPPLPEQTAIVRFLDWADRRTRRVIRARQKRIRLLEEYKQALIHRAVTGRIDVRTGRPYPASKDSGVEWLGEVPAHWEAVTLRRVIRQAVDGPHHSPTYVDSGVPFISARNIKTDRWSLDDAKFISESDYSEFCRRVVPEVGDVLYTKGGTTGVARTVDLTFRFQVWVHVAVLKVTKKTVLPEFLAASLNSPRCYEQSQLLTKGATNQDLGLSRMKCIFLALPPKAEQSSVLRYLNDSTQPILAGIDLANREIRLLHELRTRLIADVVTGKLDVREAAASLPEEPDAEEAELLEEEAVEGEDDEAVEEELEEAAS